MNVADIDEASHVEAVRARWYEVENNGRLPRVISIINEKARDLKTQHEKRINAINQSPRSIGAKIEALWQAVDEIAAVAKPYAACRRGCSHCCHTSVLLPIQEAELIGRRIGVKPARVHGITGKHDIPPGYDNPCPFLKNDECSIYASRPLACRQQLNMDIDALLCILIGPTTKVPYLNLFDYQTALAMMTAERREVTRRNPRTGLTEPGTETTAPDVGDIREFFPRGK